jgi:hypothetical protein
VENSDFNGFNAGKDIKKDMVSSIEDGKVPDSFYISKKFSFDWDEWLSKIFKYFRRK